MKVLFFRDLNLWSPRKIKPVSHILYPKGKAHPHIPLPCNTALWQSRPSPTWAQGGGSSSCQGTAVGRDLPPALVHLGCFPSPGAREDG